MSFSFNQLSQEIYSSLSQLGYSEPTEIQNEAIPVLLGKKTDLVGQAQTGTGKTAAFCIPLLEKIDFDEKGVQAVILSPTRELANQIFEEIKKFGSLTPLKAALVYGGVGYRDQIRDIKSAHVVIATPGRAIDLMNKGKLPLDCCRYFIIDEADEMLKMGFIDDVDCLLDNMPRSASKWMFSATMPKEIVNIMEQKLNNPIVIRVKKSTLSNKSVSQSYTCLKRKDFFNALKAILLTEEEFYGIVFCETREETKTLCQKLTSIGQRATAIHGELNQNQRDLAMNQFKSRSANILVCTDVAARGIDVRQVTHVINMGLPRQIDSYVHRIGRTGRAGAAGKAITFISPGEKGSLRAVERLINDKLEVFTLPNANSSKKSMVCAEIGKMEALKNAIVQRKQGFLVDDTFETFSSFFSDLSKEEAIKLLFSYQFNSGFKNIDEVIDHLNSCVVTDAYPSRKQIKGRSFGRKNFRTGKSKRKFQM